MAKNVHPLIDILKHGKSSYPRDIDDLVRSLTTYPGYQPASERIGKILWDDWPTLPGVKSDFERVRHELHEVERELAKIVMTPRPPANEFRRSELRDFLR